MNEDVSENRISKWAGLLFVLAIHGALLYAAVSYKLIPPPQEAVTLMVNLINPPKKEEPPPPEPPKPPPPKEVKLVKEKPIEQPKPAPVLAAEAPIVSATEPVAPPPPAESIKETPPAPEPVAEAPIKPATPEKLSKEEFLVACPNRPEPAYPMISTRKGEQGSGVVEVALNELGHITSVRVIKSSGYPRLDDAFIKSVKNWQCSAATQNGVAVRGIAHQPFVFTLEGN